MVIAVTTSSVGTHQTRPQLGARRAEKVRVLMSGWLVALIALIPLLAFGMWLTFNAILVRWHGLDALKATPGVYKVFMPREWFRLSPRSEPADSSHPASDVPQRATER